MLKNSIRNWLVAPFIGLFLLPILIMAAVLSLQNYFAEKEKVLAQHQKLTSFASKNISSFLHEQSKIVTSMLNTNYLPGMSPAEKKDLFARFLASVKDENNKAVFSRISLLDDKGMECIRVSRSKVVRESEFIDMEATELFRIPATRNLPCYSPIYYDNVTGEPYMKISFPVKNLRDFSLAGVLLTEVNLRSIWQMVGTLTIGNTGSVFITDMEGRVIAHKNRSVIYRGTNFKAPLKPTIMNGLSGVKSIVAAEKIHFGDQVLYFIGEVPAAEALQYINNSILITGIFLLIIFLGSLGLGYIVNRRIIKPIESLAGTAVRISNGDLTQKAEPRMMDELGELAEAFNSMTNKLIRSIEDLEKEKDFVRNVIEALSHPFYVIDARDYTIKLANSAAGFGLLKEKMTCYQLTHNSDVPCSGTDHPCTIREILKNKKPVMVEHVHHLDEVTSQIIEIYGYPLFDENGDVRQIIEYNMDVTEKRSLEAQLHQSQRLESVGVLTGGVAHDFNNLLTTIIGYSQLALMRIPEEDTEHDTIEAIYQAAQKASDLTRQLLAFSRKQVMDIKVINLNSLVNNVAKMLERLIGENIAVQLILKDAIGNIKADPGQIEQVLVNLVVNAKDAMPEGGEIYIETDTVELDESYCRTHAEIEPGTYTLLSVTDTGSGMSPLVKERIFDPFFTTKKKGEGTGLGLSTVYGIIKQLKGHIYVYSEPESGTTFKIYFRAAKEDVQEVLVRESVVMPPGTETILVVDDEESILQLIYDTLEPMGYKVLRASSGEDAIAIGENGGIKIDLLLTDVIMQKMNGKELANAMESLQPDMKVLFMSGYTDNIIVQKGILKQGVNFIAKPLVPTILMNKVRSILDS